jgi:hypothetical protein
VAQAYVYQSFGEVTARVACAAAGICGLGLKARDKIAVLSVNCPEWMIAMQVGTGRRAGGPECAQEWCAAARGEEWEKHLTRGKCMAKRCNHAALP